MSIPLNMHAARTALNRDPQLRQWADQWLKELLATLRQLRIVVFVGQKALHAQSVVQGCRPDVEVMAMPHPSPMFINRASGNRERVMAALKELAARMAASDA